MKPNPGFLKSKALIFLGSIIILTVLTTIVLSTKPKDSLSSLSLISDRNKFILSFDIKSKDQKNFEGLLTLLNLNPSIQKGMDFELDATSSARLSYLTPTKTRLNIGKKPLSFTGNINFIPYPKLFVMDQRLPHNTTLAIFGPNLLGFITSRYHLDTEILNWLGNNIEKNSPQFLAVFGQDSNFVFAAKSENSDLESLKNFANPGKDNTSFKEEVDEGITYYLLAQETSKAKEQSLTFFKIGDKLFVASSREAAKDFNQTQKSKSAISFSNRQNKVSFAIYFKNQDGNLPESFRNFLFLSQEITPNKQKIEKFLENISQASFTLRKNQFSGLIDFK